LYDNPIAMKKGEEIGKFNLGSTVVLIFESQEFEFCVKAGEHIKMGEKLGFSKGT
jgi:phosphatidylserine decarboxylase